MFEELVLVQHRPGNRALSSRLIKQDGAFVEPRGCSPWQPVATAAAPDRNGRRRRVCSGDGSVEPSCAREQSSSADGRQVGRLRATMTSFGFDPPSVRELTTFADGVTIEVKLTFVRSG